MQRALWVLAFAGVLTCGACAPADDSGPQTDGERLEWAIVIHGGAGTIPRDLPEERREGYFESLRRALTIGQDLLAGGGTSLDAVEQVIRHMEDDPRFNAGRGAVFNHEGGHELDASIMDGRDLSCGAVAGVTTVKNPISLARHVMEQTRHVLLAGPGAESFADEMGVERVDQDYFFTERRFEAWQKVRERRSAEAEKGTVGVAALDRHGNLAAGTSTGGLTDKRFGRIGDSPIIGAGTYADNRTCAVSATGRGEEFIRHGVAHAISALMADVGLPLDEAARRVIHDRLQPGDGGIIAVDRSGRIVMDFNSEGMYRGAADSDGRFEVAIWD
ncbi:MAG: isoaspartyl peptidase/L-asparaginase [Actinobacteria bacterium]|nr:isoaspartyl peptidase/L-asparaginase [Actinomycetota bacterium]NIS32506.1 isoaspartyl peptidase/L-asparaginase [Actinomycetota bacterium]NIT96288.1 isoaspartyl peptidase/L-asparaginase [Actinomycetota bacterium]NIU20003.1 isoaspartyl peptidase/L-asparaginase [Actinomycetota bacterium]NIU67533.1 isoaspartyl peptidase/L-asparaginase [Actinomycetota bacterium]